MSDPRMAALVTGLRRKSAQVKALAAGGYRAGEVARFLGLGEAYVAKVMGAGIAAAPAPAVDPDRPVAATVDPDGRLGLPPDLAGALGLTPGTAVVLRREGQSLVVTSRAAADTEVRAFVAARLP